MIVDIQFDTIVRLVTIANGGQPGCADSSSTKAVMVFELLEDTVQWP